MPDSMYDGDMEADEPANSKETPSEETKEGDNTALLPKSFFAGKEIEPGSKCELEIVHAYEDEVEVKYVPHGTKSDDKSDSEPSMKDKIAMAAT